jgi:hypothetical protein
MKGSLGLVVLYSCHTLCRVLRMFVKAVLEEIRELTTKETHDISS